MSDTPRISVITASARPAGLPMVGQCLHRQTLADFEWLVGMPADLLGKVKMNDPRVRFLADPPRRPGDFYRLNGAWNRLALAARAPLLVFACDWVHFGPEALEAFAVAHDEIPAGCVSSIGHHYRKVVDWRPEVRWCDDQRQEAAEGLGFGGGRMPSEYMELSLGSIPREKLLAVGGFDEAYDAAAGMSEKEAAARLELAGCSFWLGTNPRVEQRIYTHAKATSAADWDAAYAKARQMYDAHVAEIRAGVRKTTPLGANSPPAAHPSKESHS